jgi:hypothetical protein
MSLRAPGFRARARAGARAIAILAATAAIAASTTSCAVPAHARAAHAHDSVPPPPAVSAPPAQQAPATAAPAPPAERALALPHGWDASPTADFEEALARWNPAGEPGRLDADSLALLARALDQEPPRALRAVLLLAHAHDPAADAALLARLERRIAPADYAFPAVDVTAAAALARVPAGSPAAAEQAAQHAAVLEELAHGRRPHTMMAVRTECAASALRLGRTGAIAFLLGVLREGTPAREPRPTWTRGETRTEDLAWSQWRASQALSERAGVPAAYRPEANAIERAQIALELEQILTGARPSPPSIPVSSR